MIVAINKIDMPGANIDKVKRQLATEGVQVESYGGDIPSVEISAKLGTNVEGLLDLINLVSEMNLQDKFTDLSNVNHVSESIVLESFMDKQIGPVATVVVKSGRIQQGEYGVGGKIYGKIRAIINDQGITVDTAFESQPVKLVGIPTVLEVGEFVRTYIDEKDAREASKESINEVREEKQSEFNKNVLASIFAAQEEDALIKKLNIIVVTDAKGSLEAILYALNKIKVPGTKLNILDSHTSNVNLNDITLASARGGIVLAFNTKIDSNAEKSAKEEKILIREYKIIYELVEEIEMALIGLVEPTEAEDVMGEAEVRQVFTLSNGKFVAGLRVTKNKLVKGYHYYLLRKGERVHDGRISSLKHGKDEVKDATVGTECGVLCEGFEPMTGDILVCFKTVKA
jgi:translation initiation factor IF-2